MLHFPARPRALRCQCVFFWQVFAIALLQGGHGAPSILDLECGSRASSHRLQHRVASQRCDPVSGAVLSTLQA